MFQVINCVDLREMEFGGVVPAGWRSSCDENDRLDNERTESQAMFNEVIGYLDSLRHHLRLNFNKNLLAGPYRVDLLDDASKIAITIEMLSGPRSVKIKNRHLAGLGFKPMVVPFWRYRACHTEEEKKSLLWKLLLDTKGPEPTRQEIAAQKRLIWESEQRQKTQEAEQ
eukprot:Platyproteum_vivax@DN14247_c0_g1_i1.p1